ncbi:hypothetical protein [Streptomyces sp. NPDC058751]|uniref:hypothetical protein n=1 Tax=Streptomyces sp. NPDC058751 TaxID=3346623 RepID=UPI00368ABA11
MPVGHAELRLRRPARRLRPASAARLGGAPRPDGVRVALAEVETVWSVRVEITIGPTGPLLPSAHAVRRPPRHSRRAV